MPAKCRHFVANAQGCGLRPHCLDRNSATLNFGGLNCRRQFNDSAFGRIAPATRRVAGGRARVRARDAHTPKECVLKKAPLRGLSSFIFPEGENKTVKTLLPRRGRRVYYEQFLPRRGRNCEYGIPPKGEFLTLLPKGGGEFPP